MRSLNQDTAQLMSQDLWHAQVAILNTPNLYVMLNISTCIFRSSDARFNVLQRCSYSYQTFYALYLLSCPVYWYWELICGI